jgi:glycosyltransferase involved in cell wall biosynthesis
MEHPFVTVLLSAYNSEAFLAQALDSILAQEFDRFEVVTIDDGSTDGSVAILERYAARDSRVRVFTLESNRGISAALNEGLAHARGDYIAKLDADDMMPPGRLTHQFETLEANPKACLTSGRMILFDGSFERCHRVRFPLTRDPHAIRWYMMFRMIPTHSGSMMRRESMLRVGGYNVKHLLTQDFLIMSQMVREEDFIFTNQVTCLRRIHAENASQSQRGKKIKKAETLRIIGENLEHLLGHKQKMEKIEQLHGFWRGLRVDHLQPFELESWLQEMLASYLKRYCSTRQEERQASRAIRRITSELFFLQSLRKARRIQLRSALQLFGISVRWYPFGPFIHPATLIKRWLPQNRLSLRKWESSVQALLSSFSSDSLG